MKVKTVLKINFRLFHDFSDLLGEYNVIENCLHLLNAFQSSLSFEQLQTCTLIFKFYLSVF